MSQDESGRARVLRAGVGLKLATGLLSALVAVALVTPISGGQVSAELTAYAALALPTALGGAYRAYLRSTLEIRSVAAIALGRGAALALAIVAIVTLGAGLHAVFLTMAVINLATFAAVAFLLRRRVAPGVELDAALWRDLLAGALPLFLNAVAMTLSLRVGHIMLMSMSGPVAVGHLGAAARVSEAFAIVPEALMLTIYPLMAGLYGRDPDALMRTAVRSVRYLVLVTGVPVTLCAVAGRPIMGLLFGVDFAPAGHILATLVFTALLGATGTVILALLVAAHQETTLYRNTMVFAVLNVAVCAILIPRWGGFGAAVALLTTSAGSQVALSLLPSTGRYVRPLLAAGLRTAVAAAMGAFVGSSTGMAAVPAAAVALTVYGVAVTGLGVLNRDEIRFVRTAISSATR